MQTRQPSDLRNLAVVGHASAGKTLLTESMLVCGGVINRLGRIDDGTTVSDYHVSEQQRKISVHASLMHCEWLGRKFNIIDTPGYADFISEALTALRVGDFAVVVVHGEQGVGVGTDQVWRYATEFGIPKMLVINALDRENANYERVLDQCREHFGSKLFPISLPMNPGPGFNQVLDVLRNEIITYDSQGSGKYQEAPAAGAWAEKVHALHRDLIELIAESDDTLLQKFFDQGGLSEEEMRGGIHAAVQRQWLVPVFCTSGSTNTGVARMMDFFAKYGSSPIDREKVPALNTNDEPAEVTLNGSDPVLYVFKTLSEAQFGELSFFRIYSGSVRTGSELYNSDRRMTEKVGQIYVLNGRNRTAVNELGPGDIGAVVKLKDTHTGNTLCGARRAVKLPKVQFPRPNVHAALKFKSKGDEDKIAQGFAALHEEDPTFLHHVDPELHETVISAQGELHLEVICDRLRRRYRVEIELAPPRIAFRETLRGRAEAKYRHKKQTGGAGQFAEVWMRVEPRPRNAGVEFTQSLTGQNVDRVFVPSVEKGVLSACQEGILAGYRVVDVSIDFYDGKMHPVDSKDIAFQIAGKEAFKEAFLRGKPCLLEPVFQLEITIPEDVLGRVMGDLSSRRGRILGMDTDGSFQVVRAHVPAMELHHYATTLRSLTGGRGRHVEEFSHYDELPAELEQRIVQESKTRRLASH